MQYLKIVFLCQQNNAIDAHEFPKIRQHKHTCHPAIFLITNNEYAREVDTTGSVFAFDIYKHRGKDSYAVLIKGHDNR